MRRCAPLAVLLWLVACGFARAEPDRVRLHYMQYCMGCHLSDGSGAPSKGIPSMQGTLGRFLLVPGGREFIVQVPGVMNSPLSDSQVAALMNWLLPQMAASTMPAGTAPYTTEEIARLRKTRPADVMRTRQQLVARLHEAGISLDAAVVAP